MASSFRTAGNGDAYWYAGAERTCATNGRTFVALLQGVLGLTVDGRWGPNTAAAVIAQMRGAGLPSATINAAQAEARSLTVGLYQLIGAIYIVMHQVQNDPIAFADIQVDTDTVPPQWNTAAPGAANVAIHCTVVTATPAPPGTPAPPARPAPVDLPGATILGTPPQRQGSSIMPVVLVVGGLGLLWLATRKRP